MRVNNGWEEDGSDDETEKFTDSGDIQEEQMLGH